MTLSFTAIGENAVQHDFSCDLSSLEDALDILNIIVFQGHTLLLAHIVDEGKRTELPPEVFDGQPLSAVMKKLEKQWRAVLKKPVRSSAPFHKQWRQNMNRQRIRLFDDRIAHFDRVIDAFKQQAQRAEKMRYGNRERTRLIRHYNIIINTYKGYVARTKTERQSVLDKMSQLDQSC
ncbi:hypothetical protein [Spirosoma validum]|uniref:Uncharacterized protein n=1 Tax=Spirosoma validum TaxID=2771355 RepID=A0A927B0P0_9BACT|nr:hypothetical protein [Spirosoma validum]MBD2753395.1 hypothetical protein [Spirosoma validum]